MAPTVLRRITALSFALIVLAGCGNETFGQTPGSRGGDSDGASAVAATKAEAERAFATLGELRKAWKGHDCDTVASLTTWAEAALAEHACEAAKDGGKGLDLGEYGDVEYLLPGGSADDAEGGAWFAALARDPEPTFFVYVQAEGRWRLGAGPIPVVGKTPKFDVDSKSADGDPGIAVQARLVPTRYVAFLTDPAGVSGVKFSSGDRMRDLLPELLQAPAKVRPDRLSVDVQLEGQAYSLVLADGGALVFHALRVVYSQRPGSGRSSLAHPRYGDADVRAYTGETDPAAITGTELLMLATEVSKDNEMTTVAMRRSLAGVTPDATE
ncbi:hypothetical protein GCM10023194_03180 [Planotetraspora phitsanulokensis]|uniref:DUF8094 domain-containing protein n=1 Tax=Planotetraspora phitsanulokensis TaxID=575192 RepID=A0A8J3UDE2_9ACTN|nr:hypothetical protein Pph01_84410 [Planotetraspora phitsanulokensis]